MTAPDTETSIESIEELDFDHVIQCESTFGCENAATWITHYSCCTRTWACCDACKAAVIQRVGKDTVACCSCHAFITLADYRFEPIP